MQAPKWSETGLREQGKKTGSAFIVIMDEGSHTGHGSSGLNLLSTAKMKAIKFLISLSRCGAEEAWEWWCLKVVRCQRQSQTLHYKDPTQISLISLVLSHHFSFEFPAFSICYLILLFNFLHIWLMEINLIPPRGESKFFRSWCLSHLGCGPLQWKRTKQVQGLVRGCAQDGPWSLSFTSFMVNLPLCSSHALEIYIFKIYIQ